MTTPLPRAVRQGILAAGARLFCQQGYHGLSMREIAEAVGVSKAALYYYFKDKEVLFLAILSDFLDEMETLTRQVTAAEATAPARLRRLAGELLMRPAEQRALIRLASQESVHLSETARQALNVEYHRKFIGLLEDILRQGMATGEIKLLDPSVAVWAFLGIMFPYLYPGQRADLPTSTLDQILDIYLDGVRK